MPFLAATAAALTLAGSIELHAQVVRGHFLQVLLVANGSTPVLVTPRTTLGCYIEVEIQDPSGRRVGHLGPRATCPIPEQAEYQLLWSGADFGCQLFGVELDLLAPGRIRLVSLDGEVGDLEPEREYRLVVTYHNDDANFLRAKTKRDLRKRWGEFSAPLVNLRSEPIPYRRPA